MRLIHADNPRLWFNLISFSSARPWGFVTKKEDGSFFILDEDFDATEKEIALVAWEGINGRRFLPYGGWLPRYQDPNNPGAWIYPMQDPKIAFTPYVLDGDKWNLDWGNPDYWKIVRRIAELLKKYNTEMIFCLFDNCQFWHPIKDPIPAWACWANNVQGLSSFMDDANRAVRFTQRAILELGGMDNVLFKIVNEGDPLGDMQRAKDWYRAQFVALRDGWIPAENVSVGACLQRGQYLGNGAWKGTIALQDWLKGIAEEVWGYEASLRIYLPVHSATDRPGEWFNGKDWLQAPGIPFGQMVGQGNHFWGGDSTDRRSIYSNDGLDDKDSAAALAIWRAMIRDRIRNYKQISGRVGHKVVYEFLTDSDEMEVKLKGIRETVIGFCEGVQQQASDCLVNFHRKEYVPPVPAECKIGEVKKETCWDGSEITTHTCSGGKWVPTNAVCPTKPPVKPPFSLIGWIRNRKWLLIGIAGAILAAAVIIIAKAC